MLKQYISNVLHFSNKYIEYGIKVSCCVKIKLKMFIVLVVMFQGHASKPKSYIFRCQKDKISVC